MSEKLVLLTSLGPPGSKKGEQVELLKNNSPDFKKSKHTEANGRSPNSEMQPSLLSNWLPYTFSVFNCIL